MSKEYTKNWAPRDYRTLDELSAEIDRIETAHQAGTLTATGNWSPGQIMEHCAKIFDGALDGFEAQAPLPIRLLGRFVFKPRLGKSHMKPGIKLPAKAKSVLPADEVPTEQGIAHMRSVLGRIRSGEKMTHDSPVLGKMTHEQWVLMHLDHCRLHFGFLKFPA
ncbi:MAG: DUF1569 domain-containing protein [Phycisphaerales bacterium]|nr:DUF1569 domain-containing protein [Phycisphaerales bacterium]